MRMFNKTLGLMMAMLFSCSVLAAGEQSPATIWETLLKDKYFKGVELTEGESIIELKTPYRAEDAAIVPVSVLSKLDQNTSDVHIKTIFLFVDENPEPLVGTFHLNKDMGKADLAMRIRIDKYTNVRAIAALSNGEFHMDTNFVKAQGGCSAPPQGDLKAALKRRGKMKFRTIEDELSDDLAIGQFMVSHPNLTGLQLNQRTRAFIPDHYVKTIKVTYNGKEVMTAETGISVSADPSFRFFFKPEDGGKITAEVVDSKGETYSNDFEVKI